ncbi:MAG: RIP metalloprotease RseP [Phascolarctobacterium sp.]|nr:RIP metalloprotease RseP [Phascolarctobacterium sp.]
MLTILAAIFVFGVLVTVHEFGHFITAKMTGMRVDEFSIGFGPKIYQQKEGDTLYSLRIIPLGGYNKIAGMDPDDPEGPNSFKSKTVPARMLVIISGVLMNFLLPVVLFSGIFMIKGIERPIDEPILGTVAENNAAFNAGLKVGDKILAINGISVNTWNDVVRTLQQNGSKNVTMTVVSSEEVKTYTMMPEYNKELDRALIGISPQFVRERIGIVDSLKLGISYTKYVITAMIDGLCKIITGKVPAEVAGPLGVAQMAGEVAEKGVLPLINFVAFLSINLGIINLLPLPALDGGHLVLIILEILRGKPLGRRAMKNIQTIGVVLILALTIFSTFKDITR